MGRRNPQRTRGERWRFGTQLHLDGDCQPQRGGRSPRGAGRSWHGDLSSQLSGVFQVGSPAREQTGAPGSCSRVRCSGHHNPAPASQHPGRLGRRKDLWRWLSKPKGFCFSLGSLGSVVFPWQAAQLPGLRGVCDALCRDGVYSAGFWWERVLSAGRARRNKYYTSHLLVLLSLFIYLFILLFFLFWIQVL